MILICRAESGIVLTLNASLDDIEEMGNLELFLHRETAIDADAVLAYLSDGRRLRTDNLNELSGMQDQMIFVFNKYYLDYDLDEVLRELRAEAALQPPIEEDISATPPYRPTAIANSYLRIAHAHLDVISGTLSSLQIQSQALQIASSSLDLHVLSISDAFDAVASIARQTLEQQQRLLAGVDGDLNVITRVYIHPDFLTANVRRAIENGDPGRTLGSYVDNLKMRNVAQTCRKAHEELQSRFQQAQQTMARLSEGTDEVRDIVSNCSLLDDAETCMRKAREMLDLMSEAAATLESPASDPDGVLQELRQLDSSLRNEVLFITGAKNSFTQQCIGALRRISVLNNDVVQLPPILSSLQASFRAKNSFTHIARLNQMLYAYGATIFEVVRRKEFARFFYQRAQSILEIMAKLSAGEKKRRQVYRSDLHGHLPFDTRGMDDPVPSIDFSPSGNVDSVYSLERSDVDDFLRLLDELERLSAVADPVTAETVAETRSALYKLLQKMDSLEAGFDRIAERSLLSSSRLQTSRRRITEADEQALQEMSDRLRDARQAQLEQEIAFRSERSEMQAEIKKLQAQLGTSQANCEAERERGDRAERDLHHARAQIEGDATARRVLEGRHSELLTDIDSIRQSHAKALTEATEQTRLAERLRQELDQVRAEAEEIKVLEARNATKIASLMDDQETTFRNLEEARARGEDLELQIRAARVDSDELHRALSETGREKERMLRAQATEHERVMRDHMVEADSDRAVLQHHFSELEATLEDRARQLKEAKAECEIAHADAVGLREELQRVERELGEAQHVERLLRDDLLSGRASQSDYEQRVETNARLVAQLLDVAIAFRNSHVRAMTAAQNMTSHPSTLSKTPPNNLADSIFTSGLSLSPLSNSLRRNVIGQHDDPPPLDTSDPASTLEVLRSFDHDIFLEMITKTGSTIRKWQKQCKEYRERAKGKISFRNFAKGDLALFLPTRNSISKPWAAFNVSFPHYFLQANSQLAEQLKTREWIVARITSITERLVDHGDPDSNPYGLGDGVKYYMLEVEDWTQPAPSNKRKGASRKVSQQGKEPEAGLSESMPLPPTIPPVPPGPPEAEVEGSQGVTRPLSASPPHTFPARQRANSSPSAGPSALSRLLAQAPVESPLETIPSTPPSGGHTPSPTGSVPPPPPSPVQPLHSPTQPIPGAASGAHLPSPLRPGSRASRTSGSSRFSAGRIPAFGGSAGSSGPKSSPTTALSDQQLASPPLAKPNPPSPSPQGSLSEGMASVLQQRHRRRTSFQHVPRASRLSTTVNLAPPNTTTAITSTTHAQGSATASNALANLANSWGVSFGKKKKPPPPTSDAAGSREERTTAVAATGEGENERGQSAASDILNRFK